jgi:hypothetical protein
MAVIVPKQTPTNVHQDPTSGSIAEALARAQASSYSNTAIQAKQAIETGKNPVTNTNPVSVIPSSTSYSNTAIQAKQAIETGKNPVTNTNPVSGIPSSASYSNTALEAQQAITTGKNPVTNTVPTSVINTTKNREVSYVLKTTNPDKFIVKTKNKDGTWTQKFMSRNEIIKAEGEIPVIGGAWKENAESSFQQAVTETDIANAYKAIGLNPPDFVSAPRDKTNMILTSKKNDNIGMMDGYFDEDGNALYEHPGQFSNIKSAINYGNTIKDPGAKEAYEKAFVSYWGQSSDKIVYTLPGDREKVIASLGYKDVNDSVLESLISKYQNDPNSSEFNTVSSGGKYTLKETELLSYLAGEQSLDSALSNIQRRQETIYNDLKSKNYIDKDGNINLTKLATSKDNVIDYLYELDLDKDTTKTINTIKDLVSKNIVSSEGVSLSSAIENNISFDDLSILGITKDQYNDAKSNYDAYDTIKKNSSNNNITYDGVLKSIKEGVSEEQLESFGVSKEFISNAKLSVETTSNSEQQKSTDSRNALRTIQNSEYFTDRQLKMNGDVRGTYDWAGIVESNIVSRDVLTTLIGEESVKQLEVYNKIKGSFVDGSITPYALSKLIENKTVTANELRESGLFSSEGQSITDKGFWGSAWQKYTDTQKELNAGVLSIIPFANLGGNPVTETYNKAEYQKPTTVVDLTERYVGKIPTIEEFKQEYIKEHPYTEESKINKWGIDVEKNSWESKVRKEAEVAFREEYGFGSWAASAAISTGSLLLSPIRVLEPTVELKDISGTEWAMTGIQAVLITTPFVSKLASAGWAKYGKIGKNLTEAERAANILGEAQKELKIATTLKTGSVLETPEVANRIQVAEQAVKTARSQFSTAIENLRSVNTNELIKINRLSGVNIASDLKILTKNYSTLEKLYSKLDNIKPKSNAYAKLQNEIEVVSKNYQNSYTNLAEKLNSNLVKSNRLYGASELEKGASQASFWEQTSQDILSEPYIKGQYATEWYKTIPGAGIFKTGVYAAPGDLESILTGKASKFKASGETGEYGQFIQAQPTKYLSKDITIRGEGAVLGSEVPKYIKGYVSPAYGETFGERLSLTQPQRYKFNLEYPTEDYRGSGGTRKSTTPKTSTSGKFTYVDVKTGKLVSIESPSSVGTSGGTSSSWELTKPFDPTAKSNIEFVEYKLDSKTGLLVPEYISIPNRKLIETPETIQEFPTPLISPVTLPNTKTETFSPITETPVISSPEIIKLPSVDTVIGTNFATIFKNEVNIKSSIDTSSMTYTKPKTETINEVSVDIPVDTIINIPDTDVFPDEDFPPKDPTKGWISPVLPSFRLGGGGGGGNKKNDYNSFLLGKFKIPEMYIALPDANFEIGTGVVTTPKPLSASFPGKKKIIEKEQEIQEDDFEQTPFGKRTIVKITSESHLKSGAKISDSSKPSIRTKVNYASDIKLPATMGSLGM